MEQMRKLMQEQKAKKELQAQQVQQAQLQKAVVSEVPVQQTRQVMQQADLSLNRN